MSATLTRVTKAGGCRSGGDSRGALVHLVDNPLGIHAYTLGAALCGAMPAIMWSDAPPPADRKLCPKCQRALPARAPDSERGRA